ncbi:MAG: sigma-70 family RNA polymerase sigma factor [Ruminococcaceae bacterium]|nr:sigma-70 family RNA polymerase sigma factor [Oscillospiraceae bacterium]
MFFMLLSLLQSLSTNILYFMLHLSQTNSFPKPLSAKEEQEEFIKFHRDGDINARNKLVNHNMRLVAHIIKKYYSNYSDQEDIISIGTIGLIKAINTFDYTKGTRLATYASRCIENEIFMHFRTLKKNANEVSMNEPIDVDSEGNPLTFSDIIYDEKSVFDDVDLKMKTEKLYEYIEQIKDERKKKILIMRYGLYDTKPYTQREIAKELGISRSYVSRIETKAIEELRDLFEVEEKE